VNLIKPELLRLTDHIIFCTLAQFIIRAILYASIFKVLPLEFVKTQTPNTTKDSQLITQYKTGGRSAKALDVLKPGKIFQSL
jgi:hypothetical protein